MNNKETVKKLLKLLTKYKRTIFVILLCLLISTVLNLYIPLISRSIMDDGFIGGDKKVLVTMVLLSTCIYLINSGIEIFKEKKRVDISSRINYDLSEESFLHLMKIKIDYYSSKNYAEIMNNLGEDIGNITAIADNSVFFVISQAFSMLGGIIGLFIIDYRLTFLVLLFIPIKYIAMKYFAKRRKEMMDEYIEASREYAQWFGDSVGGVKEVRLFNLLKFKHNEFSYKRNKLINKQKQMNMLGQWNFVLDSIMVQILITILYIVGANLVFKLELTVGSIFAFITYSAYVTGPISAILNIGYLLSGIIPSTKRYYQFMDLEEECEGVDESIVQNGDIEFKDVSFFYDDKKLVLNHIDITMIKGSKNAVIGKNGSGKTTIINLLTRMNEPTEGVVKIGGQHLKDFSTSACRDLFSIVSQSIYLFNDTIRNNICLYKEIDEESILVAVKDSGLGDFIDEVTLDYVVGENGTMLSGGQKQKIAMARALIHDRPILIFDEATSNADVYSESQINGLLDTRLQNKTVIMITHKMDVLKKVDHIIFIEDGELIGEGAYDFLYSQNGDFRKLVN